MLVFLKKKKKQIVSQPIQLSRVNKVIKVIKKGLSCTLEIQVVKNCLSLPDS